MWCSEVDYQEGRGRHVEEKRLRESGWEENKRTVKGEVEQGIVAAGRAEDVRRCRGSRGKWAEVKEVMQKDRGTAGNGQNSTGAEGRGRETCRTLCDEMLIGILMSITSELNASEGQLMMHKRAGQDKGLARLIPGTLHRRASYTALWPLQHSFQPQRRASRWR